MAHGETRGWILYDGRCPICRRGVRRMGCAVERRGFRRVPLQRRWVQDLLAEREEEIPDAMLLLLPDGRLLMGVDALLYLGRRVWWTWPLAALGSLPGVRALLRPLYAWVARNRYALTGACTADTCRRPGHQS